MAILRRREKKIMQRSLYCVKYCFQKGVNYALGTEHIRYFIWVLDGNATATIVQGEDCNGIVRCFNAPWYTWEKLTD